MTWRRLHRWLAIGLVVPLIVWSITGLLFHLKPGWARAYDMLDVARADAKLNVTNLGPLEVAIGGETLQRLEVFDTAIGPLARVTTTANASALYDATTGARRSPLSPDEARALTVDAIARSPHRADYGQPASVTSTDDTVRVTLSGGAVVEVGRSDARLSQRGPDTDRIDWLYRIHYMQWTGNHAVDRVLAVLALALIWAVLVPGLVLFVRPFLSRRSI